MGHVGLDFETYGEEDLPKHGLDRYVNDPSFAPLIASITSQQAFAATYDFILGPPETKAQFTQAIETFIADGNKLVAHNANFERAVLHRSFGFNPWYLQKNIIDSAVVARCEGASSHLEAAAPQLTSMNKLDYGLDLIKLFSVPNEWNGHSLPTADLIRNTKLTDWQRFKDYCTVDSDAGRTIVELYWSRRSMSVLPTELEYERMTARQNDAGWKVDMELIIEMKMRYEANIQAAMMEFQQLYDPKGELLLTSSMQLKRWCQARGIKATSFDAEHVDAMVPRLEKRLYTMGIDDPKYEPYSEVLALLRTKQTMGGSSLSKLQKIIDTVGHDGFLRGQYMHAGAGQTWRSSGRGVQLQNLKRLGSRHMIMDDVYDPDIEISNDQLAENLRQAFTSRDPQGQLLVGDFASVESRAIGWLAGADWKTEAFASGKDMYKVQAAQIYGVNYDQVTKQQRQVGKVGELSCGYGAGPDAVLAFAKGMGVEMQEEESLSLVRDWRASNPEIVELWNQIDQVLHRVIGASISVAYQRLAHNLEFRIEEIITPDSIERLHPGAKSIKMVLLHYPNGERILERTFHGCYLRGRDVCYYKPADRKTGPLWNGTYRHPKTGRTEFYKIYGGKLSGILTQSFCRELFFQSMRVLEEELSGHPNAQIIGQFHDEIVVDWVEVDPLDISLEATKQIMQRAMSETRSMFSTFPLAAEINSDYRYIK